MPLTSVVVSSLNIEVDQHQIHFQARSAIQSNHNYVSM